MRYQLCFIIGLSIQLPVHPADLIVGGVIIKEGSTERCRGENVQLYATRSKGGPGPAEQSSIFGVYVVYWHNLGIDPGDKVYAICEVSAGSSGDGIAEITITAVTNQIARASAPDLVLHPNSGAISAEEFKDRVKTYSVIQTVKVASGVVKSDQANDLVSKRVADLAGRTKTPLGKQVDMNELHLLIKPELEKLPLKFDIRDKAKFLELDKTPEFEKGKRAMVTPIQIRSLLRNPRGLGDEEFKKLLNLTPFEVSPDVVSDKKYIDVIRSLDRMVGPTNEPVRIAIVNRRNPRASVTGLPVNDARQPTSDQTAVELLRTSPEARLWVFYNSLLKEGALSDQQKEEVKRRADALAPIIVSGK